MQYKYKAYSDLLEELGRLDYVIEINEIALRDFIQQLNNSQNPRAYLSKKCNEHQLFLSYDECNNLHNRVILGYIAQVYHATETFFYNFQSEFNMIGKDNWSFVQGKTKLDQILEKFRPRINDIDEIENYLIDTFKYYHQLRVKFSHEKTTSNQEIKNKFEAAKKHYNKTLLEKYRIKSSPKILNEIDFEDFFLFTQISKEIAFKISSICHPSIEGLVEFLDLKRFSKFKGNYKRFKSSILREFETKYGFKQDNDSDDLIEKILKAI